MPSSPSSPLLLPTNINYPLRRADLPLLDARSGSSTAGYQGNARSVEQTFLHLDGTPVAAPDAAADGPGGDMSGSTARPGAQRSPDTQIWRCSKSRVGVATGRVPNR